MTENSRLSGQLSDYVSTPKKYVPSVEDMVIGLILERHGDNYKVDIGSAHPATLSSLSFEGATRKNRPNFKVGSVVYARVILANKDMEPELSCMSSRNKADGYGELEGGFHFLCPLEHARSLLDDNCTLLKSIGKAIPYEIAVGMNGRVWINSGSKKHTCLIANIILHSSAFDSTDFKRLFQ